MRIGGKTPAPQVPTDNERAQLLWELFADEIEDAGSVRLMALVSTFRRNKAWTAAPQWAREAISRIADALDADDEEG